MATPVVKSVKPSGGDYTTLAAFDAGEARNLVTADEIAIAEIDGDWSGGPDTAAVMLGTDWTTDATRYIEIKTLTAARHKGVWDSNYYILKGESSSGVIGLQASHVRIEGLQIECNRTTIATKCFRPDGNPSLNPEYKFSKILAKGTGANPSSNLDCFLDLGTVGDNAKIDVWNCIAYHFYHGVRFSGGGDITLNFYNNTMYDMVNYGILFNDFTTSSTVRLKNNIIGDCGQAEYSLSNIDTLQTTSNISEDQTSPDGETYRQLVPMFACYQTQDFRLSTIDPSTHAKNHGATLSSDPYLAFSDDISGRSRPTGAAWDVGASETPTRSTKSIQPSGGDYTSLSAWEAGEAADLVTADVVAVAKVEGDWSGGPDTSYCSIDDASWVTDAQRRILIFGSGTARHTGRWDTSKYVLEVAQQWNGALFIQTDYVSIDGLQIANDHSAETGNVMGIRCNAMGDEVYNCLVKFTGTGTIGAGDVGLQWDGASAGVHKLWNNVVYGWYDGFYYDWGGSGRIFIMYNNTVVDNTGRGIWIHDAVGNVEVYLKNNLCNGNVVSDYNITAFTTYVHSNNLSEDTSSPDSTYRSKAVDFIDEGTDYRISVDDTDAKGQGAWLSWDLQLPWQKDINGKVRDDAMAWDIGADQFEATVVEKTVKESGGDYSTLAAFEAGEQQDLVATGSILKAKIDGTWTADETGVIDFDSADWYGAKGNYLEIYTTSTARHRGHISGAFTFELDWYRIKPAGSGHAINSDIPCRIYGLEIKYFGGSGYSSAAINITGVSHCEVAYNLIQHEITGNNGAGIAYGGSGQYDIKIYNNIVQDIKGGGDGLSGDTFATSELIYVYANTVVDVDGAGIISNNSFTVAKNNLVQQCGGNCYQTNFHASSTNNLADDATAPGLNPQNNKTVYFARSDHAMTSSADEDYRLSVRDTVARGLGADITADANLPVTDDINGKTRVLDIGADQYQATARVRVVAASGGDYTSLSALANGEIADLLHDGVYLDVQISGLGISTGGGSFDDHAWLTSIGNNVTLRTLDDGARHHGKWSDTAHRIIGGGATGALYLNITNWIMDGLQFHMNQNSNNDRAIYTGKASTHWYRMSNCIVKGNAAATATGLRGLYVAQNQANSELYAWNNIFYDFTSTAGDAMAVKANGAYTPSYTWWYNNTLANNDTGLWFGGAGHVNVLKNNAAQDGNNYVGTMDASSDSNLDDDNSAPGSNPQHNKTLQFVGKEFGDYRIIPEDTDAIDNGVDLSADSAIAFNTDIDGHTRGATWDIGASEVVTPALRSKTIRESGGDYSSFNAFMVGEEADLVHDAVYLVGQMDQAWSAADTTAVDGTGTGWVTSSVNYVKVEAIGPAKHAGGIWTATAYRLVVAGVCVDLTDCPLKHMWLKHLQIHKNTTATFSAVQFNYNLTGSPSPAIGWVEGCIIQGGGVGATGNHAGINVEWNHGYNTIVKAWNNIVYGFGSTGYKACAIKIRKAVAYLYNNTLAKSRYGIYDDGNGSDITAKNNLSQAAGTTPIDYVNSFNASSTDNLSGDATAPGLNPEINKTVVFKNKAADNYNLLITDPARDKGADLSADPNLSFSVDLVGRTREDPWDIGALEYAENGGEGDDASVALVSGVMRRNARRRIMYADD